MCSELKVGSKIISPALVLAPMSGVTGPAFRKLIRKHNPNAIGLTVTEFISVEALTRQNTRSVEMLCFEKEDRPIAVQIFGHDIERMVAGAKMAEQAGADAQDCRVVPSAPAGSTARKLEVASWLQVT